MVERGGVSYGALTPHRGPNAPMHVTCSTLEPTSSRAPRPARAARSTVAALLLAALALAALSACSDGESAPADAGPAGGPIDAATVSHCATAEDGGPRVVTVDPAACTPDAGAVEVDAGHDHGGEAEPEWGETMYGQTGDDDDCKYHLVFSTSPVRQNSDVMLMVTVTNLADGTPAAGADVMAEIYLSDVHPAPNSGATTTEDPAGTYHIMPVRFDAPGDWTVRFHLNGQCTDSEESPHGHGAFYVRVP